MEFVWIYMTLVLILLIAIFIGILKIHKALSLKKLQGGYNGDKDKGRPTGRYLNEIERRNEGEHTFKTDESIGRHELLPVSKTLDSDGDERKDNGTNRSGEFHKREYIDPNLKRIRFK
jgi:hypothetical protein